MVVGGGAGTAVEAVTHFSGEGRQARGSGGQQLLGRSAQDAFWVGCPGMLWQTELGRHPALAPPPRRAVPPHLEGVCQHKHAVVLHHGGGDEDALGHQRCSRRAVQQQGAVGDGLIGDGWLGGFHACAAQSRGGMPKGPPPARNGNAPTRPKAVRQASGRAGSSCRSGKGRHRASATSPRPRAPQRPTHWGHRCRPRPTPSALSSCP